MRLAAKLTGWKIDIKSESQAEGSFKSNEQSGSLGRPRVSADTESEKGNEEEPPVNAFEDSNATA